jgi:hypothetical protein
MSAPRQSTRPRLEHLDVHPKVDVLEAEYRRLLGYPAHHSPGARADELAGWARGWFAEHGRPWVFLREVPVQVSADRLLVDGTVFGSRQLQAHLREAGAERAMLVAVSAGGGCEAHASQLWQESKPDEYFFLEMFGSAVVENLVTSLSARICELAESEGLMAISHYSPGYTGWDIADQNRLYELITRGRTQLFPESLEVMSSGMLRPKKSLLAVVGLTARNGRALASSHLVPCEGCAYSPCQYRRAAYRHAPVRSDAGTLAPPPVASPSSVPVLARDATYSVNPRALRKWAQERVRIEPHASGTIEACFRFDGTTCSNQGRPLAFDYAVTLSGPREGYTILGSACRPAPDDDGHTFMCAYLSDSEGLMKSLNEEKPLIGRPLNDVLNWNRTAAPSGCHCSADSRAHKWGLALEAIHYALAHAPANNSPVLSP